MTDKCLFVVTYINELVVLAANQQDAERIAWPHRAEGLEIDSTGPMTSYPADWNGDCEPHGSDGQTLDELITSGCAPEYTALRDGLLSRASIAHAQSDPRFRQSDDEDNAMNESVSIDLQRALKHNAEALHQNRALFERVVLARIEDGAEWDRCCRVFSEMKLLLIWESRIRMAARKMQDLTEASEEGTP